MVKNKLQRRRNRRAPDAAMPPPPALGTVTSVTASGGSQVTVAFAQPVIIKPNNLPATWLFGTSNRTITAIASNTPTSYVFTVSGTVAAAQVYSIGAFDPAARTTTGGYIAAKSGNLA